MHTFGSNIKNVRKELGLSQAQIGKLVGVSKQLISQWEHGIIRAENIRSENMLNLAQVLKIPENELRKIISTTRRANKPDPTTLEKLDRILSAAVGNNEYSANSKDIILRLARELRIKPTAKP